MSDVSWIWVGVAFNLIGAAVNAWTVYRNWRVVRLLAAWREENLQRAANVAPPTVGPSIPWRRRS